MAPIFVRIEFCPRAHGPSSLPGTRHQDYTVPVNIEPVRTTLDGYRYALFMALQKYKNLNMGLENLRIRFHKASQSCASILDAGEIKTDTYKCREDDKWHPSDVAKTLRAHVRDLQNRRVSLHEITEELREDDDGDQQEKDNKNQNRSQHQEEEDDDDEGDEDERKSRKNPSAKRKTSGKQDDDDDDDDEDDDDDDDGPEEEPRHLCVRFCPKQFDRPPIPLRESFVRVDLPDCTEIKDVITKLMRKVRLLRPDFAYDPTTDRVRSHRTGKDTCQEDLSFETLLSNYTVSTTAPDIPLWESKLVAIHFESKSKPSAKSTGTAKVDASIKKTGTGRAVPEAHRGGKRPDSGRRPQSEGGDQTVGQENDRRTAEKGDEGARYFFIDLCTQFHPRGGPIKLPMTCVRANPTHTTWAESGIINEILRLAEGLAGRQSVRVIFHPRQKCNERLGFRQALRDHNFKTTTPPDVFSLARDKVIFIHFEDPTTGSSAQAINKAATSSSQPGQNRNRASAAGENNRGDRRHSNLVGNRPQAEANKRGGEHVNKIGRRPDSPKAKNHGYGGARYLSVQDIASWVANAIRSDISFDYDPRTHNVRFHRPDDLECVESLSFNQILEEHTTSSMPTLFDLMGQRRILVKIHFEGTPELFNNRTQPKAAQRQSNRKVDKRSACDDEEDGIDDPVRHEGSRKRQSQSMLERPAKRSKGAGESTSTDTEDAGVDGDNDQAEDEPEQEDHQGDFYPDGAEEELSTEEEGEGKGPNPENSSDEESVEANDGADDLNICSVPHVDLHTREIVRIGILATPDDARRPTNAALPMRRIVVAMVEKVKRWWPVTLLAVDSWKIMNHRIGDYPSGDPWELEEGEQDPRFTADQYWRPFCTNMNTLKRELRNYARDGRAQHRQEVSDNESERSASQLDRKKVPRRPKRPVKAPMRPNVRQANSIAREWRDELSERVDWNPKDRIDAVICFANALTGTRLETYRNFQASMPLVQKLDSFRKYIKNTRLNDKKGTLKHFIRHKRLNWWGDSQVWVMRVREGTPGLDPNRAYCWDNERHRSLEIGEFFNPDNVDALDVAQVFIEIRIVEDPQQDKTVRLETEPRGTGRCILDDAEDVGWIADDDEKWTMPP
ncbi:hypothetical protein M409DRAFT_26310 [Zasmidium cellare ATCC 36951]|uniref:Uncharacterized protein n=1 Tax=Zasmidium cellare ATCC 36951 TaxID=1080233 RepID=A0A6A6CCU1_ZASCE|nr:uncharacterized protein M409DRAFT_26310 [Zasmidium cellare ATCC 36951]KAF2163266.1 hypothetical protein M409DRAFT_26310 [Zasmidium cellare ATCC 36951]